MKLSISNIAWPIAEEPAIAGVLAELGVNAVDIAPSKYFDDIDCVSHQAIRSVKDFWQARGIDIIGMQSLLFGTVGFNLFDDHDDRMLRRLSKVCDIGGALGARVLTFGSPRNRDRHGLDDAASLAIACEFFHRLGEAAQAAGVTVCLEPCPAVYNCNFMTTTLDAADVVTAISHPAIGLQLDTGAMTINDEPIDAVVNAVAPLLRHIHASEPHLVTLGDGSTQHAIAAHAIARNRPDLFITIEMAESKLEPCERAVKRAVQLAQNTYGALS